MKYCRNCINWKNVYANHGVCRYAKGMYIETHDYENCKILGMPNHFKLIRDETEK